MITTAPTGDTLDWTVASLAAGGSGDGDVHGAPASGGGNQPRYRQRCEHQQRQGLLGQGQRGQQREPSPVRQPPDTATATLLVPALTIAKTPDGGAATAGTPSSFSIAIKNTGNAIARHLDVSDVLPAGLTYTAGSASATPSVGFSETSVAAGPGAGQTTIRWAIASLARATQ